MCVWWDPLMACKLYNNSLISKEKRKNIFEEVSAKYFTKSGCSLRYSFVSDCSSSCNRMQTQWNPRKCRNIPLLQWALNTFHLILKTQPPSNVCIHSATVIRIYCRNIFLILIFLLCRKGVIIWVIYQCFTIRLLYQGLLLLKTTWAPRLSMLWARWAQDNLIYSLYV